ncbi:MAG TPA: hypothetical protein VMG12_43685, partial [Polyangiaceae bacterium]|nr:hypothetical protein [Polyangiaceae bacterium]
MRPSLLGELLGGGDVVSARRLVAIGFSLGSLLTVGSTLFRGVGSRSRRLVPLRLSLGAFSLLDLTPLVITPLDLPSLLHGVPLSHLLVPVRLELRAFTTVRLTRLLGRPLLPLRRQRTLRLQLGALLLLELPRLLGGTLHHVIGADLSLLGRPRLQLLLHLRAQLLS